MGTIPALLGKATGVLNTKQALGAGFLGPVGLAATSLPGPPKPPSPPKPPTIGATLQPFSSLIGPGEGSMNGTFVTGNNRAANIAGGKKTLLGQ